MKSYYIDGLVFNYIINYYKFINKIMLFIYLNRKLNFTQTFTQYVSIKSKKHCYINF